MATKRLIDANALRKKIDLCDIETFNDKFTICEQIANASTVDAVPVVRCKDCKNRDEITKECKHPKAVGWDVIIPEDNDYCSYGERKEENESHS